MDFRSFDNGLKQLYEYVSMHVSMQELCILHLQAHDGLFFSHFSKGFLFCQNIISKKTGKIYLIFTRRIISEFTGVLIGYGNGYGCKHSLHLVIAWKRQFEY